MDFNFGNRRRVKIVIDGVEKEVISVKGTVYSVKGHDTPTAFHDGKAEYIHGLETKLKPEGQGMLDFVFHGPSPLEAMNYIEVGIIDGYSPYKTEPKSSPYKDGTPSRMYEALYVRILDMSGFEPIEKRRNFKQDYDENEADDIKLGLEPIVIGGVYHFYED